MKHLLVQNVEVPCGMVVVRTGTVFTTGIRLVKRTRININIFTGGLYSRSPVFLCNNKCDSALIKEVF